MNDNMKRVLDMKQYIDRTGVPRGGVLLFESEYLLAVRECVTKMDLLSAILLALNYGYAKGQEAAKEAAKESRKTRKA